jgi:sn-glycerol 3-phosphate transport system permease protein
MVENRPIARLIAHFVMIIGVIVVCFPVYYTFVASTQDSQSISAGNVSLLPGGELVQNYDHALTAGVAGTSGTPVGRMLFNSFVVAILIATGKIAISLLSAYAVVFFSFPLRMVFFWMIFITLMLPVEVRILPTYKVVSDLGMLDGFSGLTVPLIASATATLLFRQFFLTIPDELVEAAKIDGAGPLRFLRDMVIPLSRTNIAALFVILFIYGWNQYLWPLLITTSDQMETVIIGIKRMIGGADARTEWGTVMATTMLAMLPPVAVVVLMQRWFVKGLVDAEK